MKCLVIGGGLSGLASAAWLAEAGHEVTLLEKRGAPGGRTIAIPQPEVDDVPDNGQHVFASGYEYLMRFLDSVGTRRHVCFPGQMSFRMEGGAVRRNRAAGIDALRSVLGDLPGVEGLDKVRTAVAQARLIRESLRQPPDLDRITADEWFRRIGMPASARRTQWDGIVIGLTGDKPDISSAKVPADLLATGIRRAIATRTPVSIGYPTVDLDTLFVRPALELFARLGVTVRTRAPVRRVVVDGGRATGAELLDGGFVPADAVVCAVPVWQVRGMLDDVPGCDRIYRACDELAPVPIVSVNLYLDRSIGMDDWGEILVGGEGVLEQLWDRQKMHGRSPARNWFYSTTVSAAYELIRLGNREIVEAQMAMLRRYYPQAREAQVVHAHIVRMPQSTYRQRPGSYGVRPPQATALPNLALAGDWTRTDWTTTMEGACQSAARAVEVLLQAEGQR